MSPASSPTLWFATALLPQGWSEGVRITVAAGRIAAVASGTSAGDGDEKHAIGIPGASNLHSHAFQRALAGLTERRSGADSFWSWREAMYGLVQGLSAEDLQAVSALAFMEMLEAGITRVGEFHYLHHDRTGAHYADIGEHAARIAEAAQDTGIGLTLLPVFYAHGGVGGQPPRPTQRRFINSLDSFQKLLEAAHRAMRPLPFGVTGVAAHSLRAVTPEQLQQLPPLAPHGPFHIHVAEQWDEVKQWCAWSGARPVEWLLDNAAVDERWCLVHATHLSDTELHALADSRAVAGLCPITEANLGDGVFAAREFLARGGRFGIGTDSNILIDFTEELRLLEYGQRLMHRERNVLHVAEASTGRGLLQRSLQGAAQALGQQTGQLAPGFLADMISLSDRHPALLARAGDALLDSWIFAGARAIDSVWSAGRKVVSAGRHFDRERIARRYAATLAGLRK